MAQAAYSRIAYRDAGDRDSGYRPAADPPGAYTETAYAEIAPAKAPYPSAMRRARRRTRLAAVTALAAMAATGWAALTHPHGRASIGPGAVGQDAIRQDAIRQASIGEDPGRAGPVAAAPAPRSGPRPSVAWMLDPAPALGPGAAAFGREAPPAPAFRVAAAPAEPSAAVREIARALAREALAQEALVQEARAGQAPTKAALAGAAGPGPGPVRIAAADPAPATLGPAAPAPALVPLPVARPVELRRPLAAPAPSAPRRVAARALPRTRDVFRAAMAEEPSFLERLFGAGTPAREAAPRQALAYASPDALPQEAPRTRISPAPAMSPAAGTAVYDISARTVTLPSGETLEAHSGLGQAMDDPRFVHLRMRGSTPPGTYELTERERLFHGVRAIRLNPVGGSAAVHGRDGLLAHTYMLRQPGASNGCVSFRDYDRFLQAFLRGEVRRLVVVAGRGDLFGRRFGMAERAGGGA